MEDNLKEQKDFHSLSLSEQTDFGTLARYKTRTAYYKCPILLAYFFIPNSQDRAVIYRVKLLRNS